MLRKPPISAVLNSHAYIQRIVPVLSEMNRSKLLQAEAGLLLEKNMTNVLRLHQPDEKGDSDLFLTDPESLPPLVSQEKSYLRSHDPADESQCKGPTQASLFAIGNMNSREISRSNSRTTHVERLRLINRQPQPSDDVDYDSEESENPSPEDTYAEYVRTHTLPPDPTLPSLSSPPSASLLQGTAASLRRQSLPTNQSRDTFSIRHQATMATQSKQTVSLIPNKAMARRFSSSTTSLPIDTVVLKPRYSAISDLKTPPITFSSTVSSSITNSLHSRGRGLEYANPHLYSSSGNASADNGAPVRDLFSKRSSDYHTRQLPNGVSQRLRTDQINKESMTEIERRANKDLLLKKLNRSKVWRIFVMIAIAEKNALCAVLQRRETAEMKKNNAIRCIVRLLRRWQAIRCALNNIRKGKVQYFSKLYSKVG